MSEAVTIGRALEAHKEHMARGTALMLAYLEPKPDRLTPEQFISAMIEHFDGPEQREVFRLTEAAMNGGQNV